MNKKLNSLLNDKLKWLKDLSKEDCIIHSDIDGLLSMAFLQNYANMKQIVGIYDLDAFYMSEFKYLTTKYFKNLCAIDLDVSYLGIRNIGHHMTCVNSSNNSLNINEFVNFNKNTNSIVDNYNQKFPLNTIILLYSIFNIQPKTDEEIALIVYADSVFENYNSYKNNVVKWLKFLGQYNILDALNNRYSDIIKIIDEKILPITKEFSSRKKYSQCLLTSKEEMYGIIVQKYNGNPIKLLNLIRKITNWNVIDLPNGLYNIKSFNNLKVILSDDSKDINLIKKNLKKLDTFLKENSKNIVSSSMTYRNEYKITVNKPDINIKLMDDKFQFVKR